MTHTEPHPPASPERTACVELGQILSTPGALSHLAEHGADPLDLIARHAQGDFGDLGDEDRQANLRAIVTGDRILSAYVVGSVRLYLISEGPPDQRVTTLLLASEY